MTIRNLLHWIGAAIESQPFYSDEIRTVRFIMASWRIGLSGLPR